MTGYEFTYRIGRRAPQTMRRFGWTVEEATARFQRDMDESSTAPVVILSVADIGYDTVSNNLPTPVVTQAAEAKEVDFAEEAEKQINKVNERIASDVPNCPYRFGILDCGHYGYILVAVVPANEKRRRLVIPMEHLTEVLSKAGWGAWDIAIATISLEEALRVATAALWASQPLDEQGEPRYLEETTQNISI